MAKTVGEKYKAEYVYESSIYGLIVYEMAYLYADLLQQGIDPKDDKAMSEALSKTDKMMVHGRVKFDPETHLSIQGDDYLPIPFYQIWDGERVVIYPAKYPTGKVRTPGWIR